MHLLNNVKHKMCITKIKFMINYDDLKIFVDKFRFNYLKKLKSLCSLWIVLDSNALRSLTDLQRLFEQCQPRYKCLPSQQPQLIEIHKICQELLSLDFMEHIPCAIYHERFLEIFSFSQAHKQGVIQPLMKEHNVSCMGKATFVSATVLFFL